MAQISLVIFDCDGVLVDSESLSSRVLAEVLAEHGMLISEEEALRDFRGLSGAAVLDRLQARFPTSFNDDLMNLYRSRLEESFRHDLRPVPGVSDALHRIPYLKCVASNGERAKIELSLTVTSLWDHFDGRIFSAEQVARGKPEPDLFLCAARDLRVAPEECVVVEDTALGVEAAHAAGMTALYYTGVHPDVSLPAAGTRAFSDMARLPELLDAE